MIALKFKLRPSPAITRTFAQWLETCRELYNAGLQERRDAFQKSGVSLNYRKQTAELPAVKASRPDVAALYAQVAQDVLRRLSRAFENFFRRIQTGEKPGYPRFKNKNRYHSFTYPQHGFRLRGKRLHLAKIGSVRVFLSRPVEGTIKTCTIKREVDGWYVIFAVEAASSPYLPKTGQAVGMDMGLVAYATLSTGEEIPNPRYLRKAERSLKTGHRQVSRRKLGSNRRQRSIQVLGRKYQKITRQRSDFFHKTALNLIRRFDRIAVEDLTIVRMLSLRLVSKSIFDAAWGTFLSILSCKAAKAGREVVKVSPAGTSQTCLCGATVAKTLPVRWHDCPVCGLHAPRDLVSAQLILLRAGAPPAGRGFNGSLDEPRTFLPPSRDSTT